VTSVGLERASELRHYQRHTVECYDTGQQIGNENTKIYGRRWHLETLRRMMEAVNSAAACGLLEIVRYRRLLRIDGW